jgi:hypothetical protein
MRFMIIVKATGDSEAGVMPEEKLIAEMAAYHEELAKAGALLDASGLKPGSTGWRIKYSSGKRTVVDGPFAETREQLGGYFLIDARDLDEAIAVAGRIPGARKGADEIRPVQEIPGLPEESHSPKRRRTAKAPAKAGER